MPEAPKNLTTFHASGFERFGGVAALTCAGTYLIGFALLLTALAPLNYGSSDIDATAVVAFINRHPTVLIFWNLTIYVLNALALTVLVISLHQHLQTRSPGWATLSQAFGVIWAALVFGAGMVGNMAVEQAGILYAESPQRAAQAWQDLHAVELGLGGGNEIVGGVWVLTVTVAALRSRLLPVAINLVGLLAGSSGLLTVIPQIGDATGAVFGLAMISWFLLIGATLIISGATPYERRNSQCL